MSWPPTSLVSLLEIIGINLVLSGDNAVLVALAIRRVAPHHRRAALVLGVGGALAVQIVATLLVSWLFRLPLVLCVGGLALSWIALRLLRDEMQAEQGTPPPQGLGQAVWTIIAANCLMSFDNVLAIASIGRGRPALIVLGLGLSVVLTLTSSVLIAEWMNRSPVLVSLGTGVLAWTGGRMIATDAAVSHAVALHFGVDLQDGPLWCALSVVMTALVFFAARSGKPRGPGAKGTPREPHSVTPPHPGPSEPAEDHRATLGSMPRNV